jgi:ElaB/YqjD/DUF883 family membrane-anchored ribosome-binding protein
MRSRVRHRRSRDMPADAIVDGELKALRDQLATANRSTAAPPVEPQATEQPDTRARWMDLTDEVEQLLKEAEKDVAAHPLASVGAALLVGLLVGLLLARR